MHLICCVTFYFKLIDQLVNKIFLKIFNYDIECKNGSVAKLVQHIMFSVTHFFLKYSANLLY